MYPRESVRDIRRDETRVWTRSAAPPVIPPPPRTPEPMSIDVVWFAASEVDDADPIVLVDFKGKSIGVHSLTGSSPVLATRSALSTALPEPGPRDGRSSASSSWSSLD